MVRIKYAVPATVLAAGFLAVSTLSFAKPEYVKATKKACAYCHLDSKARPKELPEAGKYYKEHKTLEGYTQK
ncbi:MAG TPA: hypothetical protein VN924_01680 [Bryobacteraceae bacterium]|nr:hypothetical protein [Bryobacteraceae bacterium]